jgi:choline dehydrogenase-like flavoprotein
MDRTMLPLAAAHGARIITSLRVDEVIRRDGVAVGVAGRAAGGGRIQISARRAVVLAAGALGTPTLLLASGIDHGPVGQRFQAHPGVVVAGRFAEPVRAWSGATQGHEITGLMDQGIKLESITFDLPVLAFQLESIGAELTSDLNRLSHVASWGAGIRTSAMGTVRPGRQRAKVRFELTRADVGRVKRALRWLGEAMFAAGAVAVAPGIAGWHRRVSDAGTMARLEEEAPSDARAYTLAISHMFGTCKMGSDRETSVVRPDFRHHTVEHLYVADASAFPTNIGVNPQVSIMTLGACCAMSITSSGATATSAG